VVAADADALAIASPVAAIRSARVVRVIKLQLPVNSTSRRIGTTPLR
jgi:hypothetical protein